MTLNHSAIAPSDSSASVLAALLEVQHILQSFAQADGFQADRLASAFGAALDGEQLQSLGAAFAQGDFSGLPAIAARPGSDLNGAMGVYVAETNQVFLSESLLQNGSQAQVVAVLLEEIGHSLDTQLNATDSAGDEGAIFSALVRGQSLSDTQLAALQAENDQTTLLLEGQQVTVEQATLTVNVAAQDVVDGTTSDITALLADPGADGLISLREAIVAANNTAGADEISFDGTGTITLGGTELLLTDDLTLDGDLDNDGTPDVTVDANQQSRVIQVNGTGTKTVALDGLVITGGLVDQQSGGGILNREDLTITNSTISGNTVTSGTVVLVGSGGGIANDNTGKLTITRSVITGNVSGNDGGGIYATGNAANGASVTITDSQIYGNTAVDNGGGIANSVFIGGGGSAPSASLVTITNSTISNNSATDGGGVSNFGQNADNGAVMNITNSTISGNTATFTGGGIYQRGQSSLYGATITLTNSTVTQNEVTHAAGRGGGIFSTGFFATNSSRVIVGNSIIAQNTATTDPGTHQDSPTANAPVVDQGNNLIDIDSQGLFTTSTLVGDATTPIDPRLAPLADNGGLTQTHIPYSDSSALNAGSDALATTAALTTDQRGTGFDRFVGQTDIGAIERQISTVSLLSSDATANENTGDTATYRISRTGETVEDLTVELQLGLGPDLNASDFSLTGGSISVNSTNNTATVTLPAGQSFVDITLTPNDDLSTEIDEDLTLTLVDTTDYNVDVSNNTATATITANDSPPEVSSIVLGDANPTNADSVTFSVTFSEGVSNVDANDFGLATTGTVAGTIASVVDQGSSNVYTVTVNGITGSGDLGLNLVDDDSILNSNSIALNGVGTTTTGNGSFTGQAYTIAPGTLSIANATVTEGSGGTTQLIFDVSLTGNVGTAFTVDFTTIDATATDGSDYTAQTGTLNFSGTDGEVQQITIEIEPDAVVEPDETFNITLSNVQANGRNIALAQALALGSIINDDIIAVSINDVALSEGDVGTTQFDFTVALDQTASEDVSVQVNTNSLTATAGEDFQAITNAQVTIPAGQQSATVTVNVVGDLALEADEQFEVNLSNAQFAGGADASRVAIADGQGIATLINNDLPAQTQLNLSLLQGKTDTVNEIIFVATDSQGQINGLTSSDAGFTAAIINNAQILFSTLQQEENFPAFDPSRTVTIEENQIFQFAMIEAGSLDSLRNGSGGTLQLLQASEGDSNGLVSASTLQTLANLSLQPQDPSASSSDINLSLDSNTASIPIGSALQGSNNPENELFDFRGLTGTTTATFEIFRESAFDNIVGFYFVENEQGQVRDAFGNLLNPGDAGYAQAAVANRLADIALQADDRANRTFTAEIEFGQLLSTFIIINDDIEPLLDANAANDPTVYFTHIGANSDGIDHVRLLGNNTFGFEDLPGGGDLDFDDLVVKATFT